MDEVDRPGPDSSPATVALAVGTVSCLGGLLLAVVGPYRTAGVLVADLVVAIWTMVAFRGAGWQRQAVAGVLVLAGLAGAEALLFLPALRPAGLTLLVGFAGVGATLLFRDRPVRILSWDLAILALAATSAAALPASQTTHAGTVGVAATFALIIGVLLGRWCVRRLPERSRAAGVTLAVAAALLLSGVLAVFAIDIRRGGGYTKAYGTPVTVEVGSTCPLPAGAQARHPGRPLQPELRRTVARRAGR